MKNNLSKKQREARKTLKSFVMIIAAIVIIIVSVLIFDKANSYDVSNRTDAAEELLHDHDGDGVPDHGADAH